MELFELINGRAFPSIHALLIEPFKTIYESDPTIEKSNAIKVFSYIELMCSPKKSNPFVGTPEDKRGQKVKKEIWGDPSKDSTEFMIMGCIKYMELLADSSPTFKLLISSLNAKDKLVEYFDTFDFAERTPSGAMLIKPKEVTSALKEVPDVARSIMISIDKVNTELAESETKTKKAREIGQYER